MTEVKRKKRGISGPIAQTVLYICLILILLLVLMPLLVTLLLSLKAPYEHMQSIWKFPEVPMWGYYVEAFNGIIGSVLNSLIVCISTTAGVVLFSSATAYVFSRHTFWGREFLFSCILALMMIPSVLTMTPSFLTILGLGLKATRWALILPGIAGGQVGAIFLFRTFFSQQPKDLFESATLDGANDLVMYAKITLPLAVPILIIQALGTFSLMYNDFLWPTLVIDIDSPIQTLMPKLKNLAEQANATKPGVAYAMYLLAGVPLIFFSMFGLKYFINGDFASGMKL